MEEGFELRKGVFYTQISESKNKRTNVNVQIELCKGLYKTLLYVNTYFSNHY